MGFYCRHNLGYWDGQDYVGLGPSAVSTVDAVRYENPHDLETWEQQVEDRGAAPGETLDLVTRVNEMVMLSLRTSRGLDLKRYQKMTGKNFVRQHSAVLSALRQHDLIRMTKEYVRLTKNGMLVSNAILERFLSDD